MAHRLCSLRRTEVALGAQVSTNIRQPDLVFFKNLLIHEFSFSYLVDANNAIRNEIRPGQLKR